MEVVKNYGYYSIGSFTAVQCEILVPIKITNYPHNDRCPIPVLFEMERSFHYGISWFSLITL
jgi:hypothetical protein